MPLLTNYSGVFPQPLHDVRVAALSCVIHTFPQWCWSGSWWFGPFGISARRASAQTATCTNQSSLTLHLDCINVELEAIMSIGRPRQSWNVSSYPVSWEPAWFWMGKIKLIQPLLQSWISDLISFATHFHSAPSSVFFNQLKECGIFSS